VVALSDWGPCKCGLFSPYFYADELMVYVSQLTLEIDYVCACGTHEKKTNNGVDFTSFAVAPMRKKKNRHHLRGRQAWVIVAH
jgi:hypothetical protein